MERTGQMSTLCVQNAHYTSSTEKKVYYSQRQTGTLLSRSVSEADEEIKGIWYCEEDSGRSQNVPCSRTWPSCAVFLARNFVRSTLWPLWRSSLRLWKISDEGILNYSLIYVIFRGVVTLFYPGFHTPFICFYSEWQMWLLINITD